MTSDGSDGSGLTELRPPRRNRYYYGQLLDVLQMSTEQQYGIAAFQQLNRLGLGAGVVCGLDVTLTNVGNALGVLVGAGLALDGWGRRIIVPDPYAVVPLELTDNCGMPLPATGPLQDPGPYQVRLCYRQCQSDFAPTLVSDPSCRGCERCEAGTWVESFAVAILPRSAPPASVSCTPSVLASLQAGDINAAIAGLSGLCPSSPPDPSIPLANLTVTVNADGTLHGDVSLTPRPMVPTNQDLLALIACLAQYVFQQASPGGGFAVGGVSIGMTPPPEAPQPTPVSLASPVAQVTVAIHANVAWSIDFQLANGVADQASATPQTVLVTAGADATTIAGSLQWETGNTLIWNATEPLGSGNHQVTLRGTGPGALKSGGVPIDGGATAQWPTGSGHPGTDFTFNFDVA
jgi:hypothetical protein